jgi:serine/threonine protein kinase
MGNHPSIPYVESLAECIYEKCNVKEGITKDDLYSDIFSILSTDKLDDELPNISIKTPDKNFKSGAFGTVYTSVKYVNKQGETIKDCVIKKCNKNCDREMFVMLILYCLYDRYFPKIYLLYKDELFFDFNHGTACIMEKLDIELFTYIDDHVNNPNEFIEILIKICENLEHLQGEIEFMHRDLHTGNIMLNKNGEPVFIDAGTFSLDLTKKGIPYTINNNSNDTISILTFNKSYDLRIMFSEIYNKFIKNTTDEDGKEIPSIDQNHPFAQYLTQIFKPYPPKTRNYFYRVHSDDPNFYPENMKSELKKILDQASENPAKKSRKTKI